MLLNIQVAGHVCRLHLRVAYVLPECWFIFVPANFRHSICPILAKVMADFSMNFGMTCARRCRKYRVPRICVLSILVAVFDWFSINVSTMNIGNVWRRKGFRYLQILQRRARMCDRIFLDDDRRFSIKLDENFKVDTVSHNDKSFFVIKHDIYFICFNL